MSGPPRRRGGPDFFSFLIVNFVLCMAKLFSFRHQGTKTLRKNNKIKSFVSLCLGGKYFLIPTCPGQGRGARPADSTIWPTISSHSIAIM